MGSAESAVFCWSSATFAEKDPPRPGEKGLELPLAAATKTQYDRLVADGFGELDKSGIAELTFPARGKGSPD